jgi:outer membrane receptor protein involved in Fe transport
VQQAVGVTTTTRVSLWMAALAATTPLSALADDSGFAVHQNGAEIRQPLAAPASARLSAITDFNLPAQPLATALKQMADQAGIQILFEDRIVDGLRGPAISRRESVAEALGALLRDTDLEYTARGQTVAVRKRFNARLAASASLHSTSGNSTGNDIQLAQIDSASSVVAAIQPDQSAARGDAAAEGLDEVVVTAERRSENIQKTAVSVSVRRGDDLLQQGKDSLEQILEDIPGVTGGSATDSLGAGKDNSGTSLIIRGMQTNQLTRGDIVSPVPATAVYTDGVYEGVGGNYDIDRVEVLRGPQGTLYGRSATAGVVATYTHDPVLGQFGADGSVEVGNYALQHYSGAVNLPMGDSWALRVAANRYQRDGYDSADGGALGITDARAKLLFRPNDDLSVLLGAALENETTHTGGVSVALTAPNTYDDQNVPIGSGENQTRQYWANVEWNLGPATLTYMPTLRTWTQNSAVVTTGPGNSPLTQPDQTPFDQFVTQELRLASNADSKLIWQTGVFYYDNRLRDATALYFDSSGALAFGASNVRETRDWAVFGEATYPFLDRWRLTAGLRYDYTYVQNDEVYTSNLNLGHGIPGTPTFSLPVDDVSETIAGPAATRRFYDLTYKLRLEHDLSSDKLLYAMLSTGFLPGDIQIATGLGGRPVAMPFAQENLTSYEIGSKNRFLDERLQLNADLYYYRFAGYQTNGVNITGNPNILAFATLSVPARMEGGELEALYQLTTNDRLGLSYAYGDAYYVDEPTLFSQNVAGTHFTAFPPTTINASYTHTIDLPGGSKLALHADARYLSAHDTNAVLISPVQASQGGEPYVHVGNEVVGDLSAGWTSRNGKYSLTGYVRNVADNRYKTSVLELSVVPPSITTIPYDPRTYGVVVSAAL